MKVRDQEKERLHIRSRVEVTVQKTSYSEKPQGDIRLAKIRHTLQNLGVILSADQQTFHARFLMAVLPKIYKEEWDSNSARVMKQFGIDHINYEVLAMTPRRW
jgi:hypothetical protein